MYTTAVLAQGLTSGQAALGGLSARRGSPTEVKRSGTLLASSFVRASDRAPMSCELRSYGKSWEWEAKFYERGEFINRSGA